MPKPMLDFNYDQEVLYGADHVPAKVIAIKVEKDTISYKVRCHRDGREILCSASDLISANQTEKDSSVVLHQGENGASRDDDSFSNGSDNNKESLSGSDFEEDSEDYLEKKNSIDPKRQREFTPYEARKKARDNDPVYLNQLLDSVLESTHSPTREPTPICEPTPQPMVLPKPASHEELAKVKIGSRIEVFWPDDFEFYPATVTNQSDGSTFHLKYEHGDEEWLDLSGESFRVVEPTAGSKTELSSTQEHASEDDTERSYDNASIERSGSSDSMAASVASTSFQANARKGSTGRIQSTQHSPNSFQQPEQTVANPIQQTNVVEEPNDNDVCFLTHPNANTQGTAAYRSLVKDLTQSHKSWSNELYEQIRFQLGQDCRFLIPETDRETGSKTWKIAQEDEIKRKIGQRFNNVQRADKAKASRAINKASGTSDGAEAWSSPQLKGDHHTHLSELASPERERESTNSESFKIGVVCRQASKEAYPPENRATFSKAFGHEAQGRIPDHMILTQVTPSSATSKSRANLYSKGSTKVIQPASIVEKPNDTDVCFVKGLPTTRGTAEYRSLVKEMARSHKSWGEVCYRSIRDQLGRGRRFLIPKASNTHHRIIWQTAREDEIKQKIHKSFGNMQRRSGANKSTELNPISEDQTAPGLSKIDQVHVSAATSPESERIPADAPLIGEGSRFASSLETSTVNRPAWKEASPPCLSGPAKPSLRQPEWQSFMTFVVEQIQSGKDDRAIWRQAKDELKVAQNMSFYALTLIQALRDGNSSHVVDWMDAADKDAFSTCLAKRKAQRASPNVRLLLEEAFTSNLERIQQAGEAPQVDAELVLLHTFLQKMLDVPWSDDLYRVIQDNRQHDPALQVMASRLQNAEPHLCRFLENLTRQPMDHAEESRNLSPKYRRPVALAVLFLAALLIWLSWFGQSFIVSFLQPRSNSSVDDVLGPFEL